METKLKKFVSRVHLPVQATNAEMVTDRKTVLNKHKIAILHVMVLCAMGRPDTRVDQQKCKVLKDSRRLPALAAVHIQVAWHWRVDGCATVHACSIPQIGQVDRAPVRLRLIRDRSISRLRAASFNFQVLKKRVASPWDHRRRIFLALALGDKLRPYLVRGGEFSYTLGF